MTNYQQYNVAAPDSLAVKLMAYQRRKMFGVYLKTFGAGGLCVDVGATGDQSYDHSNYFEAWHPNKAAITAVGVDDASFLETKYPGISFRQADGRALPFDAGSFDYGHSSAVLEHVGSEENQVAFVRELWRVSRRGVFLTTPNRWFPVEFHTGLPLVHWLPPKTFRAILRKIGRGFFAEQDNLNLVTPSGLARIAKKAGIQKFSIKSVGLAGWPTNLLLIAHRE